MKAAAPNLRLHAGGAVAVPAWIAALLAVVLLAFSTRFPAGYDAYLLPLVDLGGAINSIEDWLRANYRDATRTAARLIGGWVFGVEQFLYERPWPVIVLFFVGLGQMIGGWRLALLALVSVLSWAVLRQWEASLQTLALMGVSVAITLLAGFPVGVLVGSSRIARAVVTPVLDAMQSMPAFVYLVPAIFFFGVGATTAVVATVIYAMPPIIRLTAHGLRSTPDSLIEVATSFGASRVHTFARVKLPHAFGAVLLGVNQTIMMALGLVVLAAMVGAPGLGSEIWLALQKLNVGKALEGGICIVLMAILLDRMLGVATASRGTSKMRWWEGGIANPADRLRILGVGLLALALLDMGLRAAALFGSFPKAFEANITAPVNDAVGWLVGLPWLYHTTDAITQVIYSVLLGPLQTALLALPFWAFAGAVVLAGYWLGRWRLAFLAAGTCLAFGATGLWQPSMQTLASVIVSVMVCAVLGIPLAIWSGRNERVERALRPVLDTMQTMPAFVYLVPVIMLFGANIVSALIATVIYALPPLVRIGAMGFRDIPREVDEAMACFGTHPLHGFFRVRLPLAVPALVAGLNQAIMMALAMQVITPLIGGGGLGREVFHALGLADTGRAVVAGTCVVLMAILLDRALGHLATRRP